MINRSQLQIAAIATLLVMTLLASYFLIRFGLNLLIFFGFIVPVWLSVVILAVVVFWKRASSMVARSNKRFLPVITVAVVLLLGLMGYLLWSYSKSEQIGRDKFMQARIEFDEENPQSINKCTVGVAQSYSYSDLSLKSIAEIKELIAKSSDVC